MKENKKVIKIRKENKRKEERIAEEMPFTAVSWQELYSSIIYKLIKQNCLSVAKAPTLIDMLVHKSSF